MGGSRNRVMEEQEQNNGVQQEQSNGHGDSGDEESSEDEGKGGGGNQKGGSGQQQHGGGAEQQGGGGATKWNRQEQLSKRVTFKRRTERPSNKIPQTLEVLQNRWHRKATTMEVNNQNKKRIENSNDKETF